MLETLDSIIAGYTSAITVVHMKHKIITDRKYSKYSSWFTGFDGRNGGVASEAVFILNISVVLSNIKPSKYWLDLLKSIHLTSS